MFKDLNLSLHDLWCLKLRPILFWAQEDSPTK